MRILVALDDSKFSAALTEALMKQFKPGSTQVHLLHVVEPFPVELANKLGTRELPDFVAARVQQRARGKRLLARSAEKLRAANFKVTTSIQEGDPRIVIVDRAAALGADLIMVGSHGRTGLSRLLIGSISEAVTRHALCSVQIVRIPPTL